jgi:ABC-type multidrug transport system ATPase subunit
MASFLPDDIADVPAFTNQPSWSQPEEAAELFNPIGFMDNNEEVRQSKNDDEAAKHVDNDEEVRQSKNDDDAAKHVAAEKESKAKKTKKRADYRSDPCCWCGDR